LKKGNGPQPMQPGTSPGSRCPQGDCLFLFFQNSR
jgi:hypothetical protein